MHQTPPLQTFHSGVMVSWPAVVLQAPFASCLNGPPKGLTVDLLGFFLTEDTDWAANPDWAANNIFGFPYSNESDCSQFLPKFWVYISQI